MHDPRSHWENVYASKAADAVSWYEPHAQRSLALIAVTGVARDAAIIDVGGGASTLVDDLLDRGYRALTVLDVSAAALRTAQARLGMRARAVRWIEADLLTAELPRHTFDVWHDRAVFHFLTDAADRRRYVAQVTSSVRRGGHVIVATFADDGPTQCSGLPVARYTAEALHAQFGAGFDLVDAVRSEHRTPSGAVQRFVHCRLRLTGAPRHR